MEIHSNSPKFSGNSCYYFTSIFTSKLNVLGFFCADNQKNHYSVVLFTGQ